MVFVEYMGVFSYCLSFSFYEQLKLHLLTNLKVDENKLLVIYHQITVLPFSEGLRSYQVEQQRVKNNQFYLKKSGKNIEAELGSGCDILLHS